MSQDRRKAATVSTETLRESRPEPRLSAIEEKALRMRQGIALAPEVELPSKAEAGTAAHEELRRIEAELILAWRRRNLAPDPTTVRDPEGVDAGTKRKILRALRKK
ncbi:MAG: hypothetical protein P1V51_14720 [Deltaproteobacteria bacterium]|nr:hypothetical protein [Deltaproteobacteria bacterium]